MTRILKSFWFVLAILLFIPFLFVGVGAKSQAQENNDFIKYSIVVKEDGKIKQSLVMSAELPNTFNGLTKEALKIELKALLNLDLNEKKAQIVNKYLQENNELYNPNTEIVFGDNGSAVVGKDYVGYAIEYSSSDVFAYYNNITSTYQQGFFKDKKSVLLDNPFNDIIQVGDTNISVAEKYKNIYLSACQICSIEVVYNPYYYNDYVTLSKRTKSSADSVILDADNYYHHVWISEERFLNTDDEMILSLNIIHKGWWYLLGVTIPLVIMAGAIVTVKILDRKKVIKNAEEE